MYYYLYEVKNNLNGKIYVGVHRTKSLDDGYLGSGEYICRAVRKHGKENFTKVILETFDDPASMYAREKEVVNDEFLSRDDVYNLSRGGHGSFNHINENLDLKMNASKKGMSSMCRKLEEEYGPDYKRLVSLKYAVPATMAYQEKYGNKAFLDARHSFLGKSHTEETKKQMSLSHKGKHDAEKNSQFGTCWVMKDNVSKKIKKADLDNYLKEGFIKGRIKNTSRL